MPTHLFWVERHEEARRVIEDAVAAADRSRSAAAISLVHGIRAGILLESDFRLAEADATVCWEQALASGEPWAIDNAHGIRLMISYAEVTCAATTCMRATTTSGWSRMGDTVNPSVGLAGVLLAMGDLVEAEGIVRVGLAGTGSTQQRGDDPAPRGRCSRRGGARTTRRSVTWSAPTRSCPAVEERPGVMAGSPIAEMLLAQDDPAAAFELVERVLPLNAVDPRVLDELMVWGARAAADLVERASDDRDQTAVQAHREALTRLVKTRATLPGVAFQPSGPDDTVQAARAALFAAESGRADRGRGPDQPLAGGGRGVCRSRLGWDSRSRHGGSPPR